MKRKQLSKVQLEKRIIECREMINVCYDVLTQLSDLSASIPVSVSFSIGKQPIVIGVPSADREFLIGFFMSLHTYYINESANAENSLLMATIQMPIDYKNVGNEG